MENAQKTRLYMQENMKLMDTSQKWNINCRECNIDIAFHTIGCPLRLCTWRTCHVCWAFTMYEKCQWCKQPKYCVACKTNKLFSSDYYLCQKCRKCGTEFCCNCYNIKNGICQQCRDERPISKSDDSYLK
jgi:hypothetical protein